MKEFRKYLNIVGRYDIIIREAGSKNDRLAAVHTNLGTQAKANQRCSKRGGAMKNIVIKLLKIIALVIIFMIAFAIKAK